jgi:hypothetical protein
MRAVLERVITPRCLKGRGLQGPFLTVDVPVGRWVDGSICTVLPLNASTIKTCLPPQVVWCPQASRSLFTGVTLRIWVPLCARKMQSLMPALSQLFSSQALFSAIQMITFDTYHNQLLIIPYHFDCYSLPVDVTSLLYFPPPGQLQHLFLVRKSRHTAWLPQQLGPAPMTNPASDNAKFVLAMRRNHALVLIALSLSTLFATIDRR